MLHLPPTACEIRMRRKELKLHQSDVARRAGCSQGMVSRVEDGRVDPRASTLRKIIGALERDKGVIEI